MQDSRVITADLTEMVFQSRDRDYGAYDIRKKGERTLLIAALSALFLFLLGAGTPKILYMLNPADGEYLAANKPRMVSEEIILPPVIPEEEVVTAPPPAVEEAPPPPEVEFRVPEPSDETQDTSSMHSMDEFEKGNIGLNDVDSDSSGYQWLDYDRDTTKRREIVVADPPKHPKLGEWINHTRGPEPVNLEEVKSLIGYPKAAKEAEIEGKVQISILVDTNGKYIDHSVVRTSHKILSKAIEKHIAKLRFKPALNGNEPISLWITMPFEFDLTNN